MDSIKTFDENKKSVFEDEEIKNAVAKVKEWASASKNNIEEWLYYGKKGPVGPLNWNSISNLANQHNEVFITKKETQSNPQISSVKWLPYSIVLFAADLDT
ncbi:MAG: hypothetical protein QNL65_03985 [Opitutales bacterium]